MLPNTEGGSLMTDHDKLEELLRIKAQALVRFRVIVRSDACTELSLEMHDPALFTFACASGQVRQSEEIVTMMAESKVDE
jgi:nicotinamidase-related amidase